jgi:hypothetical protein
MYYYRSIPIVLIKLLKYIMRKNMSDRLKEARIGAGFETATEAAARCNVGLASYIHHENGTRGIPSDKAKTYAKAFKVSVEWLLYGTGQNEKLAPDFNTGVPIRYKVQAGVWEEIDEMANEPYGLAPFIPDPNYPIIEQWAEQIIGDSVNKIFPDGSLIHVRQFYNTLEGWPIDKLVVVQHYKNGMYRRTVKRLKLIDGKPALIGESTNEKWNKPIIFDEAQSEFESAEINAVVIRGLLMV